MNEIVSEYIFGLLQWLGLSTSTPSSIVLHHLIALGLVLLVAWICFLVCRRLIMPVVQKIVARTPTAYDDYLLSHNVLLNMCRLVPALVIYTLLPLIFLEKNLSGGEHIFQVAILRGSQIYVIAAIMKLLLVFLSSVKDAVVNKRKNDGSHYMSGLFQMLTIVVYFIGIICMASVLMDKSPTTLFAGLGAAATVLMLVFKDTIVGLVAGVQLSANEMLRVGDWIVVPGTEANGTVREVSLTTVKVQNFDNTIVTVPPYTLVSQSFQNWRGMEQSGGRRAVQSFCIDLNTVALCTPERKATLIKKKLAEADDFANPVANLTLFRRYAERLLGTLPAVNTQMLYKVHLQPATSKGVPIEFYFFLRTKEWRGYEHEIDNVIEAMMALLPDFGLRIFQEPSGADLQGLAKQ